MSPALKYTLGRIGLFVAVAAVVFVLPVQLHPLLRLMIAVLVSAALALFLLRRWRNDVAAQLSAAAQRRAAAKERLRSALAGNDDGTDAGNDDGTDAGNDDGTGGAQPTR